MKKQEFEVLCNSGLVDGVLIDCCPSVREGWQVWVYVRPTYHVEQNRIQTSRGEIRTFATLDSAHRFVRDCGFKNFVWIAETA